MKKKELKQIIRLDKKNYLSDNYIKKIYEVITKSNKYYIYKNIKYSRLYNYYCKHKNRALSKLMFVYYSKLNIKYGRYNNMELFCEFGKNLKIYHGTIFCNKSAIIGNDVILHGMNCIGNNGIDNKAPIIGNNVNIGVGATLIGNITIADNIVIAANSLVNKSFYEKGITIAGCPAKKIK